jgi:lipoprotein-anchoring transpeptidase ErfK/SrfK
MRFFSGYFNTAAPAMAAISLAFGHIAVAAPREVPVKQAVPAPKTKQKAASDLIKKQAKAKVVPRVLDNATPDQFRIYVSLSKQRAYLLVGDEVAIDTPISSGKRAGMTPKGSYTITEKDPDHRSNIYGSFVNSRGQVVRSGVSTRIDSAPSGTHYVGAPMKWFMRLTSGGIGMHVGILPGYPASHGCIRMPEETAKLFYDHVKIGTSTVIGD